MCNKKITYRILSCTSVILCMLSIFLFSGQNAEESSAVSGSMIETFAPFFYPDFPDWPAAEQIAIVDAMQAGVRTAAHFSVYALLGLLTANALFTFDLPIGKCFFLSMLICIAYALSDELHQFFIPGRSMQLQDIAVDSLGVLIGSGVRAGLAARKKRSNLAGR